MSNRYVNAFKFVINKQGREVSLERGATIVNITMAPSNYFRNLSSLEDMVIDGHEFIVSKDALDTVSFPTPRRGDVIYDSITGSNSVTEVKELFILGALAGYRLRTA